MKTLFKQFSFVAALLCLCVGLHAQATLASTTLTAALTGGVSSLTPGVSTDIIYVASTAGFVQNSVGQWQTLLYSEGEAMDVVGVPNALQVQVVRGAYGTKAIMHNNGATVYVGPPAYFGFGKGSYGVDKRGACVSTNELVLPWININSGNIFNCIASQWQIINGPAASAVGLTALGPNAAGTVDEGSRTLPFRYVFFAGGSGTPGTNNFEVTGTATAARTITFPDASDTVVELAAAQALSNKTIAETTATNYTQFTTFPMNLALASYTSVTDIAGQQWFSSLFIPNSVTLTGACFMVGSSPATDVVTVGLWSSTGTLLANGSLSGTVVAGAGTLQCQAFVTPVAVTGPGRYFVGLMGNSTHATEFLMYPAGSAPTQYATGITAAGSFGTMTNITPTSAFTAGQGPIMAVY